MMKYIHSILFEIQIIITNNIKTPIKMSSQLQSESAINLNK